MDLEGDLDGNGLYTKEEYIHFQNLKWKNRRRMAWLTICFYMVISMFMLYKIESNSFDNYSGFFAQITFFAITVVAAYFGGSSFEEIKIDKQKLVDEFREIEDKKRRRRRSPENTDEVG